MSAPSVTRAAEAALPTRWGEFRILGYRDGDGVEHVAITAGDVGGLDVLVRVHSECLTGDVLGSQRCDCGDQLHSAMEAIDAAGRGVVVYLRGHEGRGIGLVAKLRAYELQDEGLDTVDANTVQGLPVDDRDYGVAAAILHDLGVASARLMTNNPRKVAALADHGVPVSERVPSTTVPTVNNVGYLRVKRDRLGHLLSDLV